MIDRLLGPWRRARTALRLAARELRRNPREGVLVSALVAIPAAAIMLVSTVAASQTPTLEEELTAELGQTQAWVSVMNSYGAALTQSPTDPEFAGSEDDAEGAADPMTLADVEALLPDNAIALARSAPVVHTDDAAVKAQGVSGEAWGAEFSGMYTVESGSAPSATDELMVSPALADVLKVEIGDTITVGSDPAEYTITGLLAPRIDYPDSGTLFAAPGVDLAEATDEWGTLTMTTWYLPDTSLSWDDVQVLNEHGLIAYSREVVTDPPDDAALTEISEPTGSALLATGAVGLAAAMLLSGSAFAVTFRRQRHAMAMLGATGASRSSLVGVGVARGVWLGAAGGAVGAVVGLLAGFGWVWFLLHFGGSEGLSSTWGYHVTWVHLPLVVAYGALVGYVSALVPAVAAARLDVIGVLRGSLRPVRVRRWPAVLGLGIAAAGVVLLVRAADELDRALDLAGGAAYALSTSGSQLLAAGAAAIFAGLALLVPTVLRLLSRAAGNAPVSARLAFRDAARSIGRTAPVVVAIAVTVAIGAAMVLTLARDYVNSQAEYVPSAPEGDAILSLTGDETSLDDQRDAALAGVAEVLPDATATVIDGWQSSFDLEAIDVTAVPAIQMPEENVCPLLVNVRDLSDRERAEDPRCDTWGMDHGPLIYGVAVGGAEELAALLAHGPSAEAIATLESGGAVVFDDAILDGDTVTVGTWNYDAGHYPDGETEPDQTHTLSGVYEAAAYGGTFGQDVMISRETAAAIGWPVVPAEVLVDAPEPITARQEAQLQQATMAADGWTPYIWVERGANDHYSQQVGAAVIVVALLMVFSSIGIALGLARADARQDDLTLASLGASPQMARGVAAWQGALMLVLATGIGLMVGTAWAWVNGFGSLERSWSIPWLWLAAIWVALPAFVGAAAWLFTKPPKPLHFRLAA